MHSFFTALTRRAVAGLSALTLIAGAMVPVPAMAQTHTDPIPPNGGIVVYPPSPPPALGWGYVWADSLVGSYTPNPAYQFNSAAAVNTITRTKVGTYTVTFPRLGVPGGTVQVTAYGSGTQQCKVAQWGPSGSDLQVVVRCFRLDGTPVDSQFVATFSSLRPGPAHPMAYVWANNPTAANYTPNLTFQSNSAGATNTIARTGIGAYTVRLPLLGAVTGHVQVTATGVDSQRCKVDHWGPSGADQLVAVRCFAFDGSPIDTWFNLTYINHTSIVGSDCCADGFPATVGAYAWANQPSASTYTPSLPYQFNRFGSAATITRLAVGSYAVAFPSQSLSFGSVLVTAYGGGTEFCKVDSWSQATGVKVHCFNNAGAPIDTPFDVTFLDSTLIG